jgi:hypothetical protein
MTETIHDPTFLVADLLPETTEATVSAGASGVRMAPEARVDRITEVWKLLHPEADALPSAPAALAVSDQLGPFTWSPIVFGGGVPVGGWAQLTLFRSGAVNFTGHFHVSGAPSYNVTCTYAVRAGDGTVFTFTKTGRVHGTFEAGSRDFDWGENPTSTAIASDWDNLMASWSWQAKAGADIDIGGLVDSAVKAVGQAATVIAIIV